MGREGASQEPFLDVGEMRARAREALKKMKKEGCDLKRPPRPIGGDLLPMIEELSDRMWDLLERGTRDPGQVEKKIPDGDMEIVKEGGRSGHHRRKMWRMAGEGRCL